MSHTPRKVLRTREAAAYLGLAASTLEKRRLREEGPRFVRLGGRAIGYRIEDLDAWLDGLNTDFGEENTDGKDPRPKPVG